MGQLIYITNVSLDGYIESVDGDISFQPPDDEVFAAHTASIAAASTLIYGRKLYEAMALWETDATLAQRSPLTAAFAAAWQRADKVVFSSTMTAPLTASTAIEPRFDAEVVRSLKAATDADLTIGGAQLAAEAFAAGLIDSVELYVSPVVLGGGKPGLPAGRRFELELIDEHRFPGGVVRLRYRVGR